ncbi:MAG: thiol:disulfide interchange protein DsbA/DsbL [Psychrosphaera sp.]|nr:thiol:disulfide interchange protein DsbA/DsbL [Psychrosphaera sp.]
MKKFAVLFITLLFSSMVSAIPLRFEEGKHYQVVNKVADTNPNVTEYFSFYCQHCFKFERIVEQIEKSMPKGAQFKKSHVDFMRNASAATQQSLSRALVVGEKMGIGHKITAAIFKQIHVDIKPFKSDDDIKALFAANGADVDQYSKLMKSFGVKGAANKMKKDQDSLSSRQILDSVPMLIVNNKFKINSREIRSLDDYNALIEFLLAMK